MALEIEDGTGKANADSYATALELADRAAAYGWELPWDTELQEVLLRRAAEAMNAMRWKGGRAVGGQALAWPRAGVVVDGEHLPADAIPAGVRYGQMALAAEIYADDQNPPEMKRGAVVRQKVDVMETEYAVVENRGRLSRAAPERPSAVQFADYLERRGLFVAAHRA
ncbi:MAG: hypothetical protein GX856_08760 [Gammaproteobacteria bacterium]|nr:hypothetical protein [Gammaproteobacteria bacterium]